MRRPVTVSRPDEFSSASEWADAYRALGLAVIPAQGGSKIPAGKWQEFQAGIPQTIHDRWYGAGGEHASNFRMGFLTGAASLGDDEKLLLVDLDVKGTVSGLDTWNAWLAEHEMGCEPETWRTRTGGGGQHIYFRYPAALTIRNTQETLPGIDIRAEGGFVVVPPSRHASGRQYLWDFAPWDTELLDAPQWLLDKLGAAAEARPSPEPREKAPRPEHATDVWGHIVDGRDAYMRDVVWAAVVDLYRDAPMPPSEDEGERAMLDAFRHYESRVKPQQAGRTLEDEGRGLSAFKAKWAYAMRQWDGKVAEAARHALKPTGRPEPPKSLTVNDLDFSAPPKPETIARFPFETVGDLRKLPPVQWLVKGWIPCGATGLFYGKWGAGKSFLGFDLSLHLAYGMPDWHGEPLPEGGADVLVIAREGHQGFVQRIDAFKAHHGLPDDPTRIHFMRASVSFMRDEEFKGLLEAIRAADLRPQLVLIDTVARVLPGVDMNTQETVTTFMERCAMVSAVTGAATVGVHHQNKSGGMMGSTFFEANSDFVFEISRDDPEEGALRSGEIVCTKMKDGPDRWKRAIAYRQIVTGIESSSLVVEAMTADARERQTADWLPSRDVCRRILTVIDDAWEAKTPLSHHDRAKIEGKWAQRVIGHQFKLQEKVVKRLILHWLNNGVLGFEIASTKTKAKGLKVIGGLD